MRLDVLFTPPPAWRARIGGSTVVVLDVLRATSTVVEALANGAAAVYPVRTVAAARRRAAELGDASLLCGERRCRPIPGFALGNSPGEFTPERVAGRALVLTTTNGTAALLAAATAARGVVASLLNLTAVADAVAGDDAVLILCAGRERRFAVEDALCAGALLLRLKLEHRRALELNDAGHAAAALAERQLRSLPRALEASAAGRALAQAGLAADIAFCAAVDRHKIVPRLDGERITL
ncbi:MAG: 2-phosphosulfolactate phosphatase [Gemmatimonadetes bacterium]|nr:2-phosphosulfolactate phosphatase [Gemmatimonadota bacterium]